MAAVGVTASSTVALNLGDAEGYVFDLTSVDDGDTFDASKYCGFGIIHQAIFTPTTAVVAVPSFSGTTITFKVAAGSVAGRLLVIGR